MKGGRKRPTRTVLLTLRFYHFDVHRCITEERIDLLDQLGFSWEGRPSLERPRASWYQRLEELTLFQQKYEHFQVDPKYMPELHAWSHEQRQRLRHHHTGKDVSKKLSEERVKELHAIGFTKDVPLNETKSTAKPPPDATEVSLKKVAGNIKQPVIPVGGAKTVDGNHETTVDIEKAPHMIQI